MLAKADLTTSGDPPSVSNEITGNNWEKLNNRTFANRTYYDLSGYNKSELTAFFQGIDVQEEFAPQGTMQCWVIDLITTEYVDDDTITNALFETAGLLGDLPGFPESTYNQEQVIYGRTRSYLTSSIWGGVGEFGRTRWGTCSASTADKIHITRILYTDPLVPPEAILSIPPVNYVASIVVIEEKELTFLMRQKRSYELAT
jgi:hypothetical protein